MLAMSAALSIVFLRQRRRMPRYTTGNAQASICSDLTESRASAPNAGNRCAFKAEPELGQNGA
jgi:hypothetical protein